MDETDTTSTVHDKVRLDVTFVDGLPYVNGDAAMTFPQWRQLARIVDAAYREAGHTLKRGRVPRDDRPTAATPEAEPEVIAEF